jgi:lincosamide nucleotidyltransferase A/C/D/E
VTSDAVLRLLRFLAGRSIDVWIGGGWGIDALVGSQSRDHQDLDVSIRAEDEPKVMQLLTEQGFEIVTDWRPTRVALVHPEFGELDVHPIHFEPDGSAWLPDLDGGRFVYPATAFTAGRIDDTRVPCISADLQLTFHLGYEPGRKDVADMATLADAGLIDVPEGYDA